MANQINTRIQQKIDTESKWLQTNPVLLQGELIFVIKEDTSIGWKIGDGTAHYSELDFLNVELPLTISNGGTGATTRAAAAFNLNNLGQNPVTTPTNDTPAKWIELGTGIAQFSQAGLINNQPHSYGLLINWVTQWEIAQLWFSIRGEMYQRSGNTSSLGTWVKVVDNNTIPSTTSANDGQFLRVVNSKPTWVTLDSAEEASF